ncbi:MAG: purine-nucleoside phosphorylase, partial [Anaerolineales bacterium]
MAEFLTMEKIDRIAHLVRQKTSQEPEIGMILGSGLGSLADSVSNPDKIPYTELEGWPVSTVVGHSGQLVIGELEGKSVLIMQGRTHFYEGYDMPLIGLPVRVMKRLGIDTLIVTNAAGAVNPNFEPGDLMLLTDHLNLIGMAG